MIRPEVGTDYSDIIAGSGALGSELDYLKQDPNSYYYSKLKGMNSPYLRDDMWLESVKRGESAILADLLFQKQQRLQSGAAKSSTEQTPTTKVGTQTTQQTGTIAPVSTERNFLKELEEYNTALDYDTYMLAVSYDDLDDSDKSRKMRTGTNGYEFGEYTNKEWAALVLDSTMERYDAQIAEQTKNQKWFQTLMATIGTGVVELLGGAFNFFNDIYNIGEGIVNVLIDTVSGEYNKGGATMGQSFLRAFADDPDIASQIYNLEKEYTWIVDKTKAIEDPESGGYTGFGEVFKGINESIGYMLPSMILTAGLGSTVSAAAGAYSGIVSKTMSTAIFYTGVASGNIKDTVTSAINNGLSIQDLNAGEVISNAVIKAGMQWAVEYALGRIIGFSTTDKKLGINAGKAASEVAIGATEKQALGIWAKNLGKSMLKEGLEETLQDMSDGMIDMFYSLGQSNISEIYSKNAKELYTFENLFKSFALGALTDVVISTFSSLKYIPKSQRAAGTDAEGKGYTLGVFQTMNFNEAMQTLNEWKNIINDTKASETERINAGLKMLATTTTLSNIFKDMDPKTIANTNNLLQEYNKYEAKKEELNKLDLISYSNKLYEYFEGLELGAKLKLEVQAKHDAEAKKANQKKSILESIKDVLHKKDVAQKLKDSQVTEFSNIVTSQMSTNENPNIQKSLDSQGLDAVVTVPNNVFIRSGNIVICSDTIIKNDDLASLVQLGAYEQVRNSVKANLSDTTKKFILNEYQKATGLKKATINDAINALLFDNNFYTKLLLLTSEKEYKTPEAKTNAFNMLTEVYRTAKNKSSELLAAGTLSNAAYDTLINKALETMRTGIVVYATQYVNIDLDAIDNDILPAKYKNEIRQHPNVILTKIINDGLLEIDKGLPSSTKILADYDREIDAFAPIINDLGLDANKLKEQVRLSGKDKTTANKRREAWMILQLVSQYAVNKGAIRSRGVYLQTEENKLSVVEQKHIETLENTLGITFGDLVIGNFKFNDLTAEGKRLFSQYDLVDKQSRLEAVREELFTISGKTLTVGTDYQILRVIDGKNIVKQEYIEDNKTFIDDIVTGKITTVKDVIQDISLVPKFILNTEIVLSDNEKRGAYTFTTNTLYVNRATSTIYDFLHELTHAAQDLANSKIKPSEQIKGGDLKVFEGMPKVEANDLSNYLKENFSTIWQVLNTMQNKEVPYTTVAYFLLQGELEANMSLESYMPMMGFRYNKDGNKLISPDGSKTFGLTYAKVNKDTAVKSSEEIATREYYTLTDEAKITELDNLASTLTPEIQQSALKELSTQNLYKGTNTAGISEFDNAKGIKLRVVENANYFTTNEIVAKSYINKQLPNGTLYIATAKDLTNPLVLDGKGQKFSAVFGNITTDDIASYALQKGYDSVIIRNVIDPGAYWNTAGNLREVITPSTDVIIFGNKNISNLTETEITKRDTSYSEDLGKDFKVKQVEASDKATYQKPKTILQKELEKTDEKQRKYLSQKEAFANNTNEKYFVKRGTHNNTDIGVIDFVRATSAPEDFDKLPIFLKDKIKGKDNYGTLTRDDIIYYVKTAKNIDDYTMQQIALHVFKNKELAKLTVKDLKKLENNIMSLAATATLSPDDLTEHMTVKELFDKVEEVRDKVNTDSSLVKKATKAYLMAGSFKDTETGEWVPVSVQADRLNNLFFRHYDGTLDSLRLINNLAKKATYMVERSNIAMETIGGEDRISETGEQVESETLDTEDENLAGAGETAETADESEGPSGKTYNFKEMPNWQKYNIAADIDYEYGMDYQTAKSLNEIDREEKLNELKQLKKEQLMKRGELTAKKWTETGKLATKEDQVAYFKKLSSYIKQEVNKLNALTDTELDIMYTQELAREIDENAPEFLDLSVEDIKAKMKAQPQTHDEKVRAIGKQLEAISRQINKGYSVKVKWNALTHKELTDKGINAQQYFVVDKDSKKLTYKRNLASYKNLTDIQLDKLSQQLDIVKQHIKTYVTKTERLKARKQLEEKLLKKGASIVEKAKQKFVEPEQPKTFKEKTRYKYKTEMKELNITVYTNNESNTLVKQLLDTSWSKTKISQVQVLSTNEEKSVKSAADFYKQNGDYLIAASTSEIEEAARWFLDATFGGKISTNEFLQFMSIKALFFGYVLEQSKNSYGIYADINSNLRTEMENALGKDVGMGATLTSIFGKILKRIDPLQSAMSAHMEIGGVVLPAEEKKVLFEAIKSNDIAKIAEAQKQLIDYAKKNAITKGKTLRQITATRSVMMLSSPMTALRNVVSNIFLKRINNWSSKLANNLFKTNKVEGQLNLDADIKAKFIKTGKDSYKLDLSGKQVTPEIQKFISEQFIDNGFFSKIISNINKYSLNDLSEEDRRNGLKSAKLSREAIMTKLIVKSMYGQYYNENMFNSKNKAYTTIMNKMYSFVMKALSDDNFVREAAVRYFAKILVERQYQLDKVGVNDNVMNDFAISLGLALNDYMHSENLFNKLEKQISETSETGYFIYKTLLPFASASWNWFKQGLKLSPLGLGRAIVRYAKLESTIRKAEADWQSGKSTLNPQLVEYMAKRDLGTGIIGTIGWLLGLALGAFGIIRVDDEDYGTPKLKIGNVSIDISDIYGSSSILSGGAFTYALFKGEGVLAGLNNAFDYLLDDFALMDIVQLDMYSNGTFNMGLNTLGDVLLSFIPNFLQYISKVTTWKSKSTTGKNKFETFLYKGLAKLPGLSYLLPDKPDVYTGESFSTNTVLNAVSRVIPYLSFDAASKNERKTEALGLTKKQLKGSYEINGESFNITGKDLTAINVYYGQLNSEYLTKFYNNQLGIKVKTANGQYQTLTYNKMNDSQRKNAVQNIMSSNAELAKIKAWTSAGNYYYGTAEIINKLKASGVTKNIGIGTTRYAKKTK